MNVLIVILASVLFGIMPSIQNHVLLQGVTPIALVVLCNAFASLFALVFIKVQRGTIRVSRPQFVSLLVIGAVGLFTTDLLLDIAYTMIPVGYVTMIHFLYPTLVCFAMSLLFGQRLTKNRILAMVLSVAGLFLLTGGGFSGSFAGIAVALATAVFYAFYMIASDKTAAAETTPLVRVFYVNLVTVLMALAASCRMDAVYPVTVLPWLECALIGLMLCGAIGLLNVGISRIGAGTVSFLNMVEPVTSLVLSALVFRYPIAPVNLMGCGLILGSLVFAARSDN